MAVACCLDDRWFVKAEKALPDLRSPTAAAFKTEDAGALGKPYFALICDPRVPARLDVVEALSKLAIPELLVPVAVGPILWTPQKRRCRILVFPEPEGKRLPAGPADSFAPWTEQEILVSVVGPLLSVLVKMEQAGVSHRGIRADNLFVSGSGAQRRVILGECVSAPPGFDQPPAYLTVEDSSADPPGRSNGSITDDLYALGVLILHLATGRLPCAALNAEQVLQSKLDYGSPTTLVGGQSVPGNLVELVRGLTADRVGERWTIADIAGWLGGRRPMPRTQPGRAVRPIEIEGKTFVSPPSLAHWLVGADERQVSRVLRHPELEPWLTAALHNPRAIERLRIALSSSDGGGKESASLVTRVAIIIDPVGPIRYRNLACAIDGIGMEIAGYMHQAATAELKLLSEMILARLPQFWAANQNDVGGKSTQRGFVFERIARFLMDTKPGNGIERAAYELVPTLHCLSSLVERQFVDDLSGMLTALEAGIAAGTTDGWPIDRHITAFIAARTPESIDSQLSSLNSNDLGTRWGTTARMFATLQEASGPAMLPGLTRAMASLGSPLIDRFHNRATRKKLRAGLNDVVNLGRLKLLVDYLDDEDALKRDHMRFERAKAGFKGTQKGLEGCDQAMADLTARSIHVGATICVTVSAVLSTAIVMVSMLAMGIF